MTRLLAAVLIAGAAAYLCLTLQLLPLRFKTV